MDDRTRRTLTFFLFMVLGPFLTATLCGAIAVRRLPFSVSIEENVLRRQIGCDVKIEKVEFQRWNAKKYKNCSFTPSGAEGPVFTFPELNLRTYSKSVPGTKSIWEAIFPFLSKSEKYYQITAPTLVIELDSEKKYVETERLAHHFVEHFRLKNLPSEADVFCEIEEIQVRVVDSNPEDNISKKKLKDRFQLTFFEGTYTPRDRQFPLQCKFMLRDQPASEPVALTVERVSQSHDLMIQFNTGSTPVPIRFVALLFPGLDVLGYDASFHGTVRGQSNGVHQWALFFEDMDASNINFGPLAKNLTPYPMSGKAQFGIDSSKLISTRGSIRFVGAKGWVQVVNGTIHRGLLENLIDDRYFNLEYQGKVDPLTVMDSNNPVLPLMGVGFYFHLTNGKATITPNMSKDESKPLSEPLPEPFLILGQDGFFKYYLSGNMSGGEVPYSLLLAPLTPPKTEKVPLTPQMQNLLKHIRLSL